MENPQHPYTRALIACIPKLGAKRKRLSTIGDAMAQDLGATVKG
ncbi:MAG: hypothetical protein ACPGC0_04830 [Opitutales bacterium]